MQDTSNKAAEADEVEVVLSENGIQMEDSIPAGKTTFNIRNDGSAERYFQIEGDGIQKEVETNVAPGEEEVLTVSLEPGTYVRTWSARLRRSREEPRYRFGSRSRRSRRGISVARQ